MKSANPLMNRRLGALGALALALCAGASPARAQSTYAFDCITNSAGSSCADGESTLRMTVSPGSSAADRVDFTFSNFSAQGASITEIYFDDGTLLGLASVTDSGAGVLFSQIGSSNPGNLPGGNSVTPAFQVTAGFQVDVGSGGNSRGVENKIDAGQQEFVTINFTLQSGKTYADTLSALNGPLGDGNDLRVGLHVRGFTLPYGYGASISESFINVSSPIPEPASALLLTSLCLGGLLRGRGRRPD